MKLLFPFAKRFIAGDSFSSSIPVIQKLMDDGYEVSVDYLGELSKTGEDCERAFQQYCEIIDYYCRIDISVKLSQLGLKIDKDLCIYYISALVEKAQEQFDEKEAREMERKLLKNKFTFTLSNFFSMISEIICNFF